MPKSLHSAEYQKLTTWLKQQRELKGLSMRELADKMGISHSYIGKVEQRERNLDVVEYLKYCKALKISPIEGLRIIDKNI